MICPCWTHDYMSGQWHQSGLVFTQTKVYGKHPSRCGSRSGFPRCCHWIYRQCPRFFSLFFTSFKEHIIIRSSRKRDILGSPQELINGFLVRPLILSDGAYPPTAWQVRPYSSNLNLSDTEKSSNKHLSLAGVTVKRAFGVLKGRWRCLLKRLDNDLESVSSIIITCCVLYNICQQNHDNYINCDDVLENVLEQERRVRRNRISNHNLCDDA